MLICFVTVDTSKLSGPRYYDVKGCLDNVVLYNFFHLLGFSVFFQGILKILNICLGLR